MRQRRARCSRAGGVCCSLLCLRAVARFRARMHFRLRNTRLSHRGLCATKLSHPRLRAAQLSVAVNACGSSNRIRKAAMRTYNLQPRTADIAELGLPRIDVTTARTFSFEWLRIGVWAGLPVK